MKVKIYIIQQYDRDGTPREIIDVKLTFRAAHDIAKRFAPAKVLYTEADKSLNVCAPVLFGSHRD